MAAKWPLKSKESGDFGSGESLLVCPTCCVPDDKDKGLFANQQNRAKPSQGEGKKYPGLQELIFKRKKKIRAAFLLPVEKQGDQTGMPGHDKFCNTFTFLTPWLCGMCSDVFCGGFRCEMKVVKGSLHLLQLLLRDGNWDVGDTARASHPAGFVMVITKWHGVERLVLVGM